MQKQVAAGFAIVGAAAVLAVFATNQNVFGNKMMNLMGSATDAEYVKYVSKYGKSYGTKSEFGLRESIFEENQRMVSKHNQENGSTYRMTLNRFADMTPKELVRFTGGVIQGEDRPQLPILDQQVLGAGTPVDWTPYMNPVKNQGQCGSCWAFSAVAITEGRYAIKYGSKVQLSEQQLLDCTTGCYGCKGGWISKALQYVQANGAMTAIEYPYLEQQGVCNHNPAKVAAKVSAVYGIKDAKAVIASGPFGMLVNAVGEFAYYGGGIFNGYCGKVDHAVVAVGWGIQNGVEFWIIRNSWGAGWGENGYIRVQMGGNCQLQFDSLPIIA